MVRLSVMYANSPGSRFDWKYYLDTHVPLARRLLTPYGLVHIEIDRAVAGVPPGAAAPYHAVAHLSFPNLDELNRALMDCAPQLIADVPNYTDAANVLQISERVEA